MSVTRRRFMEGTVHAAMLSVLSRRAFGAGAATGANRYALKPVFQYLRTWKAPVLPYSQNGSMTLGYDMVDWMAPGGGGEARNSVVGRLTLSRRRSPDGIIDLSVEHSCGHDQWTADVTCRDDRWCTPVEWDFRSEPRAPHPQFQNLVASGLKGKNNGEAVDIIRTNGRTVSVPFSGSLMFPFAMLACPEKWDPAAAGNKTVTAVRDLYYLLPDQHFVADGQVSLAGGTSLSAFLQHGPGWVPANYVSGPTGLPLAMTGFLISYILTDAEAGGAA
jgi:hypothetical protein